MHSRTHLRGRARLIMEPVGVFLVNTTMGIIGCGTASSPGARGTSGSGRDTMSAVATADEEIFPAGAEDGNVNGNEEPDITQGSDDEFSDYEITATQNGQDPSTWKFEVSSRRGSVRNELFFVWESEGESYTGRNVNHTFSRAGTHLITVTGSNAKGAILFVLTLEVTIPVFNQAPIANCGPDETVEEGTLVLLSGVGSYDPDEDRLIYVWAQGNGPPVELLENDGVTTSFVAPTVDEDIDLTITLTVSDGEFSSQDSVRVYVVDLVDTASVGPTADAGPDQSVIEAGSVTLDGSQSSSENGGSLSFEWFQFSGPSVALSNPGAAVTTFAAPAVGDGETATLEFELIVTEGGYLSASDEVRVTVEPDASGDGGSDGGGGDPPSGCASDADCDDGDSCNGGETCQSGACVSGAPVACDDGDVCNGVETCQAGVCVSGTALTCDDGLFCNGLETCDATLGCQPGPAVNCDDGDACNGVETCQAGVCVSGTPPTCDDGLFCNGLEACDTALGCQAGAAVNCDDGVSCTVDSCNEATDSCDNSANDAICDDGQYCNGVESCHSTLDCQAGTAVNCDDGVACTDDACNEGTDSCDNVASDANCDDGQYCNGAETCHATLDCQAGTAVNCDDGVACTIDSCNEGSDSCDNVPSDSLCDNGSFCDGSETCDAAVGCQAGGDPCPAKDCNEGTDSCEDIICAVDADCSDGLWCTGTESCVSGTCQAGTAVNCDDGVSCTDDSCNEGTDSCDNIANDANCDNGLFCDGTETCHVTLGCQAGSAPNCADGIACTDDSCNEGTDSCDKVANNANCDNGLFCDGAETCNALLGCQPTAAPCAGQICDESGDLCVQCLLNADCDDGVFCNGLETCASGTCQAGSDPCAGGPCEEASDTCTPPTLSTNVTALDFGLTTTTLNIEVWNSGGGTLTYAAAPEAGVGWLSVTPTAGSSTGEHDTLAVAVDRTGLTDGNYQADIIVTPSGGSPILIAATIAVVAAPPVTLDESFENYSCAENPLGWVDTGPNNSLSQDDSLFSVLCPSGNKALGTSSTATNIHSHYTAPGSLAWSSYTYSGRMMIAQSTGGVGVTFLSDFTSTDAYYRLRRFDLAGSDSFHIDPHGTSITAGTTDTGVVPTANQWYRFSIEVADTGSRTEIKAKVWPDGSPEPASWQVDCYDSSGSRRTAGTVGVWSMGGGEKYWDDVRVYQPSCEVDTDTDGVVDCQDGCPQDGNKTAPGICGCGVSDTVDTDGDTVPDCIDQCPGAPDADSDGDGVPDCIDQCPGAPDVDSDSDGTMDCTDGCPNDANKTAPGVCGCGVADADSDGDGTRDCSDGCPTDPNKTAPGVCGCNRSDVDESGNPILDPANCPAGQTTSSITQWGITWTFDHEYEYGQFVNGDYWVVGPVSINSISPPWDGEKHGSMVNPNAGSAQAYHTRVIGYSSSLNVASAISPATPLRLLAGSSLVSTIGWSVGDPGAPDATASMPGAPRPSLKAAAVLTILEALPPDNGATVFRPTYANTSKFLYSSEQLHIELLPRLPFVPSSPTIIPNIVSLTEAFRPVWLDHQDSWFGRYIHPMQNMPTYGRDIARRNNDGFLALLLDYSDSAKKELSIGLIQIGIDNYGVLKSAGEHDLVRFGLFGGGAGQGSGRKLPIVFAGVMLNKPEFVEELNTHGPLPFQEDCQTFYATQEDVDRFPALFPTVGEAYWGTQHCNDPTRDDAGRGYRACCSGNVWSGAVLFSIIMSDAQGNSLKDLWNHEAFFEYEDHYMDPTYPGSYPVGDWNRSFSNFAEEMWDTFRYSYP